MGSGNADLVRNILIVRSSALGDVIHTLPALAALRRLFPQARVSWVVEPLGAALLDGHPDVHRFFVPPRQKWKQSLGRPTRWPRVLREVFQLTRELRRERFDLVLDFQGNLRSAVTLLLAGGRRRVGFHREDVTERPAAWVTHIKAPPSPPRTNKVDKNLSLVRALGFQGSAPQGTLALSRQDVAWARAFLGELPGSGPAVVLHPTVSRFGKFKQWPAEHFRGLIDLLRERHDARVAITWGPGEEEQALALQRPTVLPEAISLKRLAALLHIADLLIAADTGALPMAATVGTATVGLFGPKDATVYRPASGGEVVRSPAPCSPCRLRSCEHSICMAVITPAMVMEKVESLIQANSRSEEV
jgi:lipopolysaccharide heptosyltransferase I